LMVMADGEQTRDFTYIDDAVEGLVRLGIYEFENRFEIVNLGRGEETCIDRLADVILNLINTTSKKEFCKLDQHRSKFEVSRRYGNNDKLYELTSFRPQVDLVDGLSGILEEMGVDESILA